MKIEKLYTLSQFVDLIREKERDWNTKRLAALLNIYHYNDFLKQPLKKEMFVNELHFPIVEMYDNGIDFEKDVSLFKEAEKKVIFDLGFNIHFESINEFRYADVICDTLMELAEASEGELKLKNVEI